MIKLFIGGKFCSTQSKCGRVFVAKQARLFCAFAAAPEIVTLNATLIMPVLLMQCPRIKSISF